MERKIIEYANKVFEYLVSKPKCSETLNNIDINNAVWGMDIDDWDWNAGVGLTAMMYYYKCTNDENVLKYLEEWVARNKHQIKKSDNVNAMSPLTIFPSLYFETGESYYKETAIEYMEWIMENATKTSIGALQHGWDLQEEVWADTIFMVVIYMSEMTKLTGQIKYAIEAQKQLLLHLQCLQDEKTGVLYHGYECINKSHKSGALWGRGNAWLVSATPIIIENIKDYVEINPEILERYKKMVDGIISFQANNGLWHTVLTRQDFYYETSATAGFGFGIKKAINLGILGSEYTKVYEGALEGVLSQISENGSVLNVSGGTPIMKTIDEYGGLSCYPTMYGQGLALMLLGETLNNK